MYKYKWSKMNSRTGANGTRTEQTRYCYITNQVPGTCFILFDHKTQTNVQF